MAAAPPVGLGGWLGFLTLAASHFGLNLMGRDRPLCFSLSLESMGHLHKLGPGFYHFHLLIFTISVNRIMCPDKLMTLSLFVRLNLNI
jgi:hypothetical protein